jgi:predicted phage tail protein
MGLKKIVLTGELGKKYGRFHYLDVASPGEAIRAFCANFKDFAQHLIESQDRGVGYRCFVDRSEVGDAAEVNHPFSRRFIIAPVIGGAKNALFTVLAGVALVAAAFFMPASIGALAVIGSTTVASLTFSVGAALLLSGVSGLLAGTPKQTETKEAVENKPSYIFNGAVNTSSQGQPVPLGYGRLIVGSAVISAGIEADDYDG